MDFFFTAPLLSEDHAHHPAVPALEPLLRFLKSPTGLTLYTNNDRTQRYHLAQARLKNAGFPLLCDQHAANRFQQATSYEAWLRSATELDELEGNDEWKSDLVSDDYDYKVIKMRLEQLRDAQLECEVAGMLFLIRTTFSRNIGNMGNINLYRHSHTGTKRLVEEYINASLNTIDRLLSTPKSSVSPTDTQILESLIQTRQAYGRTALLLSGGATLGMTHVGVVKALYMADLLPRIISGASAGSIVASVICSKTDDEIPGILENFADGDLAVFDDPENPETMFQHVARFLTMGAWVDIKYLTGVMKTLLGDMTFQESYYRTRRVLNICVSSESTYDPPRLLNYITSPNVIIWSAVAASCSVPVLFSPTSLLAKDPLTGKPVPWNPSQQRWIDGSVDCDLPMTRLSEIFNVNHFIVSQVNPHVAPFMSCDDYPMATSNPKPSWGAKIVNLAMAEAMHRMAMVAEIGLFKTSLTKAKAVLSQKYTGDITILPEIPLGDYGILLKNPTPEFMHRSTLCGQRATWPKLSRVRNHCAIELALDKAIHTLRTRVVFSPSQAGLRLSYPGSASPRGRRRRVRSSDGTYFHRTVSATRDGPVHVRPLRHPEAPTFVVEEHLQTADSSDSGEEGTLNVKPPLRRRNTPPPRIAMPPSFTQTHQNPFYLFMTPSQGTSPLESKKKKTAGGDGYMECSGSKSPRRHMRRKSADAAYILAMTKAER